jgi:rhodanese-related sulfurtransferase
MKTYKLFFLIPLAILLGSCNANKENSYANVDQMVNTAQENITKISVLDLKEKLDHNEILIIDCRETEEYIKGHIPGALNIPRGLLEFSSKISNRREVIYIYSETVDRASLAYPVLKSLKYKSVFLVDGGWIEWFKSYPSLIEEGLGTAAGVAPPKKEESGGCGG